ncbi:MAG TPA: potassium channel family protein [Candidatus Limnocylindria bacterium]|nr:potassium channel family protein [Candidatus Limnocylindria bacterium]
MERIERLLDGPATFLAVVFVLALAAELVLDAQGERVPGILSWTQTAIWVFFGIQFALGILVSPDRLRYLRRHWITAISLVLPFFRILRILRAARALRALSGFRALSAFNRAARSLAAVLAWSRAGYPLALAGIAAVLGSATLFLFEADAAGSRIASYSEALWWTLSTLTTIGANSEPVTLGGRIVGLGVMVCGLVILGYVAGVVGALLFERRSRRRPAGGAASAPGQLDR